MTQRIEKEGDSTFNIILYNFDFEKKKYFFYRKERKRKFSTTFQRKSSTVCEATIWKFTSTHTKDRTRNNHIFIEIEWISRAHPKAK